MRNDDELRLVSRAAKCFWLAFFANCIIIILIATIVKIDAVSPFDGIGEIMALVILAIRRIVLGIAFFLVLRKLLDGENWARFLCLLYGIYMCFAMAKDLRDGFDIPFDWQTAIIIMAEVFGILCVLYALYLLFISSGKNWFSPPLR